MQANWKRISSLILVFAIVFTTLFNGVSIETVKAAASATTIDVTNLDAGATYTHDCSKYAVNKYDATYHWKACSVCGKVIAGTKAKHSLKDNGWTMGSAALCSGSNHHVYTCSCGYSKNDDTGRAKHTYNTPCNCWGRHTHYHCTVCGSTDYQSGMSRTENCIEAAKKAGINVDCFTSFTCPTCGAKYVKDKSTKTWNIYNIDWKNGGKTATHKTYEPNANAWNFAHNRTARFGTAVSDGYLETDNDGVWCQDCGLKLIKIVKDGQYLCYSTKTHRIYFGSSREDIMLFQNERQADNIAYDYRAKKTEYTKGEK